MCFLEMYIVICVAYFLETILVNIIYITSLRRSSFLIKRTYMYLRFQIYYLLFHIFFLYILHIYMYNIRSWREIKLEEVNLEHTMYTLIIIHFSKGHNSYCNDRDHKQNVLQWWIHKFLRHLNIFKNFMIKTELSSGSGDKI